MGIVFIKTTAKSRPYFHENGCISAERRVSPASLFYWRARRECGFRPGEFLYPPSGGEEEGEGRRGWNKEPSLNLYRRVALLFRFARGFGHASNVWTEGQRDSEMNFRRLTLVEWLSRGDLRLFCEFLLRSPIRLLIPLFPSIFFFIFFPPFSFPFWHFRNMSLLMAVASYLCDNRTRFEGEENGRLYDMYVRCKGGYVRRCDAI